MTPDQTSAPTTTPWRVGALSDLPDTFPAWARRLAELYFSGTTAAFVLYGNTYDYVRTLSLIHI